jgi:hypothetical protein
MTSQKYWFVCDQDECDSAVEFHARDGFGFPSGEVKMTCPCGKQMQYVSTQPTEGGTTMTTTEQAVQEAVGIASLSEADKLRVDLESQRTINDGLRTTINNHRNQVRDLYTMLNDAIQDGKCEETSNITFGEVSDILNEVFGSQLVFTKEYEVQVRYTVYASFKVTAASEEDARSIAEEIGISADIEWDIDNQNTEVDTWSIDDTRIEYIQEA